MLCLCIENISWWGMMHACSAFICYFFILMKYIWSLTVYGRIYCCRLITLSLNSNLIWRTVSRRVDEVIPTDHPRRVAVRVIQWYDLIHKTRYCTPDQVTILIICLLYAFFLTFFLILKPVLVFNPEKLRERLP